MTKRLLSLILVLTLLSPLFASMAGAEQAAMGTPGDTGYSNITGEQVATVTVSAGSVIGLTFGPYGITIPQGATVERGIGLLRQSNGTMIPLSDLAALNAALDVTCDMTGITVTGTRIDEKGGMYATLSVAASVPLGNATLTIALPATQETPSGNQYGAASGDVDVAIIERNRVVTYTPPKTVPIIKLSPGETFLCYHQYELGQVEVNGGPLTDVDQMAIELVMHCSALEGFDVSCYESDGTVTLWSLTAKADNNATVGNTYDVTLSSKTWDDEETSGCTYTHFNTAPDIVVARVKIIEPALGLEWIGNPNIGTLPKGARSVGVRLGQLLVNGVDPIPESDVAAVLGALRIHDQNWGIDVEDIRIVNNRYVYADLTVDEDLDDGTYTLEVRSHRLVTITDDSHIAYARVFGTVDIAIAGEPPAITGIDIIASTEDSLPIGATRQLTATVLPSMANQTVKWKSSDVDVAKVSEAGEVLGVAVGTATITATATDGKTATITITVVAPPPPPSVEGITVTGQGGMEVGATQQLTAVVTPADAPQQVTWTTSNAAVATVSAGGLVTAVAPGTAIITATAVGGRTASLTITVTNVAVTGVSVTPSALSNLEVGATRQLTATVTPTDAPQQVTWTTSNAAVATVSAGGLVTAVAPGTATITATAVGGKTATVAVTAVPAPITGVMVQPASVTMTVGDSRSLSAGLAPKHASAGLTWTSSDPAIVSVQGGDPAIITALKEGNATITATAPNGVSGNAMVTVERDPLAPPVPPTQFPTFTPDVKTFDAGENGSVTEVLGAFEPGTGETWAQIQYYYDVVISSGNLAGKGTIAVAGDGTVTLYITKAGTEDFSFDYTWKLNWKAGRGEQPGALNGMQGMVSGNTVTVLKAPDKIDAVMLELPPTDVGAGGKPITMGSIGNVRAFKANGVPLKTTIDAKRLPDAVANGVVDKAAPMGFDARVTADGEIVLDVKGAAVGVYDVTVTVSAAGCEDQTTNTIRVTVTEPPSAQERKIVTNTAHIDNKKLKAKNRWTFDYAEGEALFEVAGETGVKWKSSKPKKVEIDATTGLAKFKGKANNVAITATLSDGKTKCTQRINVQDVATQIKLQYKKGGKWVDFDLTTPLQVVAGKRVNVRAVAVSPTKKAVLLNPQWTIGDPNTATINAKRVLRGVRFGSTTLTVTLFKDVAAVGKVEVMDKKGISDEFVPELEEIVEIEEAELEPVNGIE